MALTQVWAFRALRELGGATGRVDCEEELARELIERGDAQDLAVGAVHLKEIEAAPRDATPAPLEPQQLEAREYQTTQLPPDAQHTTDLTPPKGRKSRGR